MTDKNAEARGAALARLRKIMENESEPQVVIAAAKTILDATVGR